MHTVISRRQALMSTAAAGLAGLAGASLLAPGAAEAAIPTAPTLIYRGPTTRKNFAFTFDGGQSVAVVRDILAAVESMRVPITIFPNGGDWSAIRNYGWEDAANVAKARLLISQGLILVVNHSWNHPHFPQVSYQRKLDEIRKQEAWVQAKFGVSPKPFFRPPYGESSTGTKQACGALGYPAIMMWSSDVIDWKVQSDVSYLSRFRAGLKWGGIQLAHMNVTQTSRLTPVMFREARAAGYNLVHLKTLLA